LAISVPFLDRSTKSKKNPVSKQDYFRRQGLLNLHLEAVSFPPHPEQPRSGLSKDRWQWFDKLTTRLDAIIVSLSNDASAHHEVDFGP
jgi:hypothetical protein